MFRIHLERLEPGMVLGKTLYTTRGELLLARGVSLSPGYIALLRQRGVAAVFVEDGMSDDVVPRELISPEFHARVATHVSGVFDEVARVADEHVLGDDNQPQSVAAAVEQLGESPLPLPGGSAALERLYSDVERLIAEVLQRDAVASLESLKNHSTYTYQHSVDVAALGALLGAEAGLTYEQLRELTLGCLLHDIGKMYIDVAILEKPGPLTPAEFDEMKKHPLMGFELIRRMPVFSILPAHVAYQHHERQDGTGYPRGLDGTNLVRRDLADRLDPQRMLLIAEITAVADVYSAVSSDRPYRAAMPPDKALQVVRQMATTHLNRSVVDLLDRVAPRYPVGYWVEVRNGLYRGWRGVVTEVLAGALNLPMVRLLLDPRGESVSSPIDLDLRQSPHVELECLQPGANPLHVKVA